MRDIIKTDDMPDHANWRVTNSNGDVFFLMGSALPPELATNSGGWQKKQGQWRYADCTHDTPGMDWRDSLCRIVEIEPLNPTPDYLQENEMQENNLNINLNQAITLLDESFKTVKVCFNLREPKPEEVQASLTTYKIKSDQEIKVGDLVVTNRGDIDSPDYNFAIVHVIDEEADYDAALKNNGLKWIVGVVDTNTYLECMERDKSARKILLAEKRSKKRKEIKAYIEETYNAEGLTALGFTGASPVIESEE